MPFNHEVYSGVVEELHDSSTAALRVGRSTYTVLTGPFNTRIMSTPDAVFVASTMPTKGPWASLATEGMVTMVLQAGQHCGYYINSTYHEISDQLWADLNHLPEHTGLY
jgi:hypothetical protein